MGIKLFYSYSHKDEDLRDQLEKHLKFLVRQGIIEEWHDRRIGAGSEWSRDIDKHLNAADIILLLISSDFIASDYCYDIEMRRALELHHQGESRVIPIIVRPVNWRDAPFGHLQSLPRDAKPVTTWVDVDEAWVDVTNGIRLVCEQILSSDSASSGPTIPPPRTSHKTYQLFEIFLKSGVPNVTFVEPVDFDSLKLSLLQPGRGVVIEGPTGIGKTTALRKAIEQISPRRRFALNGGNRDAIEIISARNRDDVAKLQMLSRWHDGPVAIEDFHRLDIDTRLEMIDYLKYLADTEPESKKLVIVGIPRCGQTLVQSSSDVATRFDVFELGRVNNESVVEMIEKGEQALNITFDKKAEIALAAGGSLNVAQFLCFKICEEAKIVETQPKTKVVNCDIDAAVSKVISNLSRKFEEPIRRFATLGGRRDSTCLELLEELRQREDGFLPLLPLQDTKPHLASGIEKFISGEWMKKLYSDYPDAENHLFFDPIMSALVIDDPQLAFYLGRLSFTQLAKEAGKSAAQAREQIFISYSHRDTKWLERLQVHLKPLVRKGTLTTWADTNIRPGERWKEEIQRALASARVAVLLVSPEFLASDFIAENELPPLLRAAGEDGLTILWVALSASLYTETELSEYQAANNPSRPLDSLSPSELNRELVRICSLIKSAANS